MIHVAIVVMVTSRSLPSLSAPEDYTCHVAEGGSGRYRINKETVKCVRYCKM